MGETVKNEINVTTKKHTYIPDVSLHIMMNGSKHEYNGGRIEHSKESI